MLLQSKDQGRTWDDSTDLFKTDAGNLSPFEPHSRVEAGWIRSVVAMAAAAVLLGALIYAVNRGICTEIRDLAKQQREEDQSLSKQQTEDFRVLVGMIEKLDQREREDVQSLAKQQREDFRELVRQQSETAERTARIEGALIGPQTALIHDAADQALPTTPPEER